MNTTNYNVFPVVPSGPGGGTHRRTLSESRADINLYRYAVSNALAFSDRTGLDVRICCRQFDAPILRLFFDHCYIESNTGGGRRTWGLYGRKISWAVFTPGGRHDGITAPHRYGVPRKNDKSDIPDPSTRCGPWYPMWDSCLDDAIGKYPIEDYSEFDAPTGSGTGRNSNTFTRCMVKRCGLPYANGFSSNAAGYYQPCPPGF